MANRYHPIKFSVVVGALMLLMVSCEKETIEGPQGDTGPAGKDATVTTTTLNVPNSSWHTDQDSVIWRAVEFSSLLSKDVVDKGIVKISILRSSAWYDLPLTDENEILTQFGIEQGQVQFEVVQLHGLAPRPVDQKFKMVVIPPQ